jgi:hypothetical protein
MATREQISAALGADAAELCSYNPNSTVRDNIAKLAELCT